MQVIKLRTGFAGTDFSHDAGSLVLAPDEMAVRFIDGGLADASDVDPDADNVVEWGHASDELEVLKAASTKPAGAAPPRVGPVSVVEPQPPHLGSTGPDSTVTGLGAEYAWPPAEAQLASEQVAASSDVAVVADGPEGDRVVDVKAYVGNDPARAQAALDRELAKPEEERRPTLVEHLQKLVDAAS